MPAYNEAENIENVVNQWHPIVVKMAVGGSKLLVVNDGSKDNTLEILYSLKNKYPCLEVVDKPNSGHGATVLYAYRYALEHGADYVFQTDSDGQTLPEEFWPMWEQRKEASFHIGMRLGRQDGVSRVLVSRILRLVVWLVFGVWVKDANTPFRLMKTDRLATVMKYIPEDFFLANVAVSAIAVKNKESVAWYPITFRPRQGGVNSINLRRIIRIGWKALDDLKKISRFLS